MTAKLSIFLPGQRARTVPLTGALTIGRGASSDLVLESASVSRGHALLRPLGRGNYFLLDLGSANGTFLNGRLVTAPVKLNDGDTIMIADCTLVFEGFTAQRAPTAPTMEYKDTMKTATISILVVDIRDFTHLSEALPAKELPAFIGGWFRDASAVIERHGGTIDKFIGDAVMAFWGAPLDDPEHARHAVAAALAMRARLPALHAEMASHGWPALAIHIGINTGQVVVGDMGSRHRRAYTVMGDAVNLAARLQALASRHALGLVLGDSTWRALALGSQAPLCLALGAMDVKGRDAPVLAWHPLIWPRDQPVPAAALVQDWDALRAAVSAGRHAEASALLQALQRYSVLQPLCRWQRALLQASGGAAQAA